MKGYLAFRIADEHWDVDVEDVERVLENEGVFPVAGMASWYAGLLYHRGELLEVIDLFALLGGDRRKGFDTSHLIVISVHGRRLAVMVDEVTGLDVGESEESTSAPDEEVPQPVRRLCAKEVWKHLENAIHG